MENLLLGLSTAASFEMLLFVFIGCTVGTLFGAFPGLSAPTAIALLLPLTFSLDPTAAIIMLAGIYYGSQFGNSIAAVLLGIPGDSAAVVTAMEGHALAKRHRAGHALTMAAVASFGAGVLGVVLFVLFGPSLAWLGLKFGDPEYAALILLAFTMLPAFAEGKKWRMVIALLFGLFLSTVGLDYATALPRFTFDQTWLLEGIPFVPAIIGLFGVADAFYTAGQRSMTSAPVNLRMPFRSLFPALKDWVAVRWTLLRSAVLGFFVGILPGAGATIASFAAYAMERNLARDRKGFGNGRLEGLAAGEAGNSGASIGAMLPMLALGIPGSGATAVILGGFLIWGLQPGPMLFEQQPVFVWGLIASMLFGNMMLLFMNVLLVPVFAQALRVPKAVLAPLIIIFCVAGAYATNNSMADVWIMFAFGLLGLLLRFAQVPIAPLVLGLVLGLAFEKHLRRSLQLSDNGLMIFLDRPISLMLLILALVVALAPFAIGRLVRMRAARQEPAE